MKLRRWKHGGKPLMRPDTHDPGKQRGYMASGKGAAGNKKPSSSKDSKGRKSVKYWPVLPWGQEGKRK